MPRAIDCLFIGYNEIPFVEYEKMIAKMSTESAAYRDLNLNFIQYNNRPYTASDIFNLFSDRIGSEKNSFKPLSSAEVFSSAIAYLATYLDRRGFTYDLVNSFREEKEELVKKLEKENILTIAIVTTFYVTALPILEIVEFIKKHNRTAKIVIGGPFILSQVLSQEPLALKYLFENTIGGDFYVNSSQGEAILVKIIHALKNNLPYEHINNIYYKTDRGMISTPTAIETDKLCENMVNWELFPSQVIGEYVNVRTSISCPYSCAFCNFPEQAGEYQAVECDKIYPELSALNKRESVKFVNFIDDTFNIPQRRFKDILKMMIRSKFKFKWIANYRCQSADKETVQLIKESGCEGFFLGIESGSNRILKNMNKAATREEYLNGIALLKKFGIATFGSFILGFPGENAETVEETVNFLQESGLDFYRVHLWFCFPFTPVWKDREKYEIKGSQYEWSHSTMNWKRACNLLEEMFVKIKGPVWVPMNNFTSDGLWRLRMRGFNFQQIKDFLRAFNSGIKQKLADPTDREIHFEIIDRLKKSFQGDSGFDDKFAEKTNKIAEDNVKFNF